MALTIFWVSLTCIAYVYAGYPLLLIAWRHLAPRPVHKSNCEPSVSLVIAMHNESTNVAAKMRNCLDLDYPANKLQIVVSLDAPTDDTEALVRQYAERGIEIVCSPMRRGKASALNSGMALATGEIVVFADARQRFDRSAVRELVANFVDESVGAVSGQLILLDTEGRESRDAVGLYWRYEKALRAMESEIHSVSGATGAIYAIRRELFSPLRPNTVLDDVVIPMRMVLKGKRAIFDPAARAYDKVTQSPESEYEKKRRTLMGNYELFAEMPELLLPWRNSIFVQLISHKFGRLLVPYCLAALMVSNLFLLRGFYLVFFASQVVWYLLACTGWMISVADARGSASLARNAEPRSSESVAGGYEQ
jgi:biofilm PGA synthesis N-glycosyltransferase PgaC